MPVGLGLAAAAGLLYLHLPMAFILLYAFTTDDKSYQFPPPGLTLDWFAIAWQRQDIWSALGPLAAGRAGLDHAARSCSARWPRPALYRSRFFGREAISLLLILPIALPGIVTGIALRSAITSAASPTASGRS